MNYYNLNESATTVLYKQKSSAFYIWQIQAFQFKQKLTK